uniref:Uncharacterized protein n=1 Tax=Toxoplasma gondii COUG TaxID=1074873 RepID=A0A2G8XMC3_TOXGO|nr:hypothetical protein TGCOUG_306880 [Toxoplasma gondii COUG]
MIWDAETIWVNCDLILRSCKTLNTGKTPETLRNIMMMDLEGKVSVIRCPVFTRNLYYDNLLQFKLHTDDDCDSIAGRMRKEAQLSDTQKSEERHEISFLHECLEVSGCTQHATKFGREPALSPAWGRPSGGHHRAMSASISAAESTSEETQNHEAGSRCTRIS